MVCTFTAPCSGGLVATEVQIDAPTGFQLMAPPNQARACKHSGTKRLEWDCRSSVSLLCDGKVLMPAPGRA